MLGPFSIMLHGKVTNLRTDLDAHIAGITASVSLFGFGPTQDCETGDLKAWFSVPASLDGWNLVDAHASVAVAGTTGSMTVQIHNIDNALDMLSTKLTVASAALKSDGTEVINTANDHVNTDDRIRIDVDAIHTTPSKGLEVRLVFQAP